MKKTILVSLFCFCLMDLDVLAQTSLDTLHHQNRIRRYYVHLPPSYQTGTQRVPLIFALHGGTATGESMESNTKFSQKSNDLGFIAVYPESYRFDSAGQRYTLSWNAGNLYPAPIGLGIDDVGFISKLMDKMIAKYRIDTTRIYVSGLSAGGMMTYRLVCELSNRIAAAGCVSTSMVVENCHPSRAVPIMDLHSTLDRNIPQEGGIGGSGGYLFNSVDSTHRRWAKILRCQNRLQIVSQTAQGKFTRSDNCACNSQLQYYLTTDGGNDGHTWFEPPSSVLDATQMLLSFFSQYTRTNCLIPVGTPDWKLTDDFKLYPIPAQDYLILYKTTPLSKPLSVAVFDGAGRMIHWGKMEQMTYQLPIQNWSNGNYAVRLSDGQADLSKMIIVQK